MEIETLPPFFTLAIVTYLTQNGKYYAIIIQIVIFITYWVRKGVQLSNPRYLDSKFARQEASMISQILLPQDSLLVGSYIFGRVILARIFCLKQKQNILHKFMNI